MPRADRYMIEGYVYHLTHRCHNRDFLLRFAEERNTYREWLRVGVSRYKVPMFAYTITNNHVHAIVHARDREAVARLMDLAAGATARHYNRRKHRSGAFWEGKYHATAVESGLHLWRCLRYVDLNMVRAGKVQHPGQWRWCGYDELTGRRKRYRILDVNGLLQRLDGVAPADFQEAHALCIAEELNKEMPVREAVWTEGLAVGSRSFVERVAKETDRTELIYSRLPSADREVWSVREAPGNSYGADTKRKSAL